MSIANRKLSYEGKCQGILKTNYEGDRVAAAALLLFHIMSQAFFFEGLYFLWWYVRTVLV